MMYTFKDDMPSEMIAGETGDHKNYDQKAFDLVFLQCLGVFKAKKGTHLDEYVKVEKAFVHGTTFKDFRLSMSIN